MYDDLNFIKGLWEIGGLQFDPERWCVLYMIPDRTAKRVYGRLLKGCIAPPSSLIGLHRYRLLPTESAVEHVLELKIMVLPTTCIKEGGN